MASRQSIARMSCAQQVSRTTTSRIASSSSSALRRQAPAAAVLLRRIAVPQQQHQIQILSSRRTFTTTSLTRKQSQDQPISPPPHAEGENKIYTFDEMRQLAKQHKQGVVIVDTREPYELQDTGKIPGAVNIPITTSPDSFHISEDEFEDRFGFPRPDKKSELVFYCKAGVRGRAAAQLAKNAGWTRTSEYPGSWLDWAAKGGEVER